MLGDERRISTGDINKGITMSGPAGSTGNCTGVTAGARAADSSSHMFSVAAGTWTATGCESADTTMTEGTTGTCSTP